MYRYADGYKKIELENKTLINEINDYKTNLRINKEIISGLFSNMDESEKVNIVTKNLHEELKLMIDKYENSRNENEEIKAKIYYYENIINESIFTNLENIDILKNKIFILENSIIKKDNIIYYLKKKLNNFIDNEDMDEIYNRKELYVNNEF